MKRSQRQSRQRRTSIRRIINCRSFRPLLEHLETRLAPANVDVLSYHYDALLSGNNNQENILTPTNVNPGDFGLLFTSPVDGQIYASPLYKSNLTIPGQGVHNVGFVVTEHDSVYAFDADNGVQLWQRSFISGGPGGPPPGSGVTSVPSGDTSGNIFPEYGITGTPVIDGSTMYVVAQTKEIIDGTAHYVDKLHAIDITTGNDRPTNAMVTIGDSRNDDATHTTLLSVPGDGAGSQGGMVSFNAWRQLQRPALALVKGVVYVGFAGYNDQGPYHGWVVGYRADDLALQGFINMSPNARAAGIWQSGGGFASDGTNLYFATGNTFSSPGHPGFDPTQGNYGESVINLSPSGNTLMVSDYFAPFNWQALDNGDLDLGSGGTMLLPDEVGSAAHAHLMVETGKTGNVYLIDRDMMGHNVPPPGPDTNIVQTFGPLGGPGIWGNPSFFLDQPANHSGLIFYHGSQSDLLALRITNGRITGVASHSNQVFGFPGGQPIISSLGTGNAIAWDLQVDGATGNTILHAYNPLNLAQGRYHSNLADPAHPGAAQLRDRPGGPVKFTPPTVTNGHVLVGTASTFAVYGLFDPHTDVPAAPLDLTGGTRTSTTIQMNWTNPTPNDGTGIKIERSTDPETGFAEVAIVGRNSTSYTDTGLTPGTQYYYRIRATNQAGDSDASDTVPLATRIAAALLAVTNLTHAEIDLSWTQTGNDHYRLDRSFNGGAFNTIADNIPITTTTYFDTDVATRGLYAYRVTAFNIGPPDSAVSNTVAVTNSIGIVDHMAGFANHDDLTANGNTQFTNGLVRLTTNVSEVGTVFTNQRTIINRFTTTFTFRIHDGSNPPADGFTFIIQNNSPTVVGGGGGCLGYCGIGNSVAIKFDMYTQATERSTTGLFFNGDLNQAFQIDMTENGIDLRNANVKQVDLSYDGTTLSERVTDTVTQATFTHDYVVNISSVVGGDATFVGFGGGTGGYNALQDIQTWIYTPILGAPPAPTNALVSISGVNAQLSWTSNSVNEDGFKVERSDNRPDDFQEIATVTIPRFTDPNPPPGNFYYRIRAFNSQGNSNYSNLANIIIGPVTPFADHLNGFASHADLQLNGAAIAGTRLRLTDGGGSEGRTAWTTTRVGIVGFSTSFLFQVQNVIGSADGITFAIQNNDPGQVGGVGGCLGYCGIGQSVAVMFDLYSGGNHHSTTNLLLNGNRVGSIEMGPSGIVLGSNHPLRVDLGYDITQLALSETVTDTVTGAVFQHVYSVNIPQVVMGSTAYVGFTGGTGGETAIQDILSWSGRFLDPVQPVSHVSLSAANSTAGMPISVTVTAQDAFNNVKPDYRGTVHFTSSDPLASLPDDYPFIDGDNGVHTFPGVILRTAGRQTITAQDTDPPTSYIRGRAFTTVTPAAASQFLVAYPTPTTAGQLHFFTITAQDPYHNTAPTYRGTVHLTSSDGQAILSDDAPFSAGDNGTHTFAAVFFTAATQTLTATDTADGTITGTQTGIIVDPSAVAGSFTVTDFQSPVQAGTAETFTIRVFDRYGNAAPGYRGTITFSTSDGQADLPKDYTFSAKDNGAHTFTEETIFRTRGRQSLAVRDTANGATGSQDIIVTPNVAVRLRVFGYPSPTMTGALHPFTVTALDAFDNEGAIYTGTIHFTSSDELANLPGDTSFQPEDNGTLLFAAIFNTEGIQSLTAVDTVDDRITGTQDQIEVVSGSGPGGGGHGRPFVGISMAPPASVTQASNQESLPVVPTNGDNPQGVPELTNPPDKKLPSPQTHKVIDLAFSRFAIEEPWRQWEWY